MIVLACLIDPCEADAVADSIRWPVIAPDRDVRGFQSVLCDLGARLKLPGFIDDDGNARFKDYADYMVNHERKPGLAHWQGGVQKKILERVRPIQIN